MTTPNDVRRLAHLPRQPIPLGRYLVHNQVIPEARLGQSGFRAWTQGNCRGLVRCHCNFGGCKNAKLHKHYRVQFGENAKERRASKVGHDACQKAMRAGGAKLLKDGKPVPDFMDAYQALRERASRASQKAYRQVMRED